MDTWPITLPQKPLLAGHSITFGDANIRFKPTRGPSIVRQAVTNRIDTVTYPFRMTAAQKAEFDIFYDVTLKTGSLPYLYLDPKLGVTCTFGFEDDPTESWTPLHCIVTLNLWRQKP
jgi:hypothetical protein